MSKHIRNTRSRRTRALLAGGMVLGLGTAVTLATWTTTEFAQGSFKAGSFGLEGSSQGTEYSAHTTEAAAATLLFKINPTNISPNETVYAPYRVRLDNKTTTDANVKLGISQVSGAASSFTYGVRMLASPTDQCNSSTGETGTVVVPAGSPLSLGDTVSIGFPLTKGLSPGVAGAAANLCFSVTSSNSLEQGQQASAVWRFTGTSAAPVAG